MLNGIPMNRRRLLRRISQGALNNVSFADMVNLIQGFGFQLVRVSGSHFLFEHPDVPEVFNLQARRGEAKPYQIRQFMAFVDKYNLYLEDK